MPLPLIKRHKHANILIDIISDMVNIEREFMPFNLQRIYVWRNQI